MMKHPGILLGNAIFFLVFRKRDGHCFEATVKCNCTLLFTVLYILSFDHVSRKEWCTTVLQGRFFIVTTEPHSCDLVLLGNYATFSSTLFWEHLMSRRIFMGKSLPLGTEQLETLVYPHKLRIRTVALACDGRGSCHQSLGFQNTAEHLWCWSIPGNHWMFTPQVVLFRIFGMFAWFTPETSGKKNEVTKPFLTLQKRGWDFSTT